MRKVLLVHINLMNLYEGFKGDIDPREHPGSNPKDQVHERYNFKVAPDGKVYGAWCEGRVCLERIDPSVTPQDDKVKGVLVIFWATVKPGKRVVVGWYRNATVWRTTRTNTHRDRNQHSYIAESRSFTLVEPPSQRESKKFLLPLAESNSNRHGVNKHFGNWYALDSHGKSKNQPWLSKLLVVIDSYRQHASADAVIRVEQELDERNHGFQSNVKIRRAIENYAEKQAISYFTSAECGYTFVRRVGKPYDLIFEKNGDHLFVEVKGTQTNGRKIFLTVNEVEVSDTKQPHYALFICSQVTIPDPQDPVPEGGTCQVLDSLHVGRKNLRPILFEYLW